MVIDISFSKNGFGGPRPPDPRLELIPMAIYFVSKNFFASHHGFLETLKFLNFNFFESVKVLKEGSNVITVKVNCNFRRHFQSDE